MTDIVAHVGQRWISRGGAVRVVAKYEPGRAFPIASVDEKGGHMLTHTFDGSIWGAPIETANDLISEVPE